MNKHIKGLFAEITTVPTLLQNTYYPSLDGIRGVAIIMVVFSHLKFSQVTLNSSLLYNCFFNGGLGVLMFFVLSGFLITSLCLKEKVVTGDISLKNFYIRRVLRIFPVAYLYLAAILILNYIFKLQVHYLAFIGAAIYLMDISSFFRKYYFSWYTGHYWSLAVEEQFYIVVPFILKKSFKLYILLILFIVFILPFIICLQYLFPVLNTGVFYAATHLLNKFQAIAIGCFYAVLIFKYPIGVRISKPLKVITNLLAIGVILLFQYDDFFSLRNVFTGSAVCFLTGYVIITNLQPSEDPIFWFLNSFAMKQIGVLSYSIYIWQQLFTAFDGKLPNYLVNYPFNLFWIIAVSAISYYFYERFFLSLKTRFTTVKPKPIFAG